MSTALPILSAADRGILRALAARKAEIAALPCHADTIRRCRALNALKPERPLVMIDQLPWNELGTGGELTLHCENPAARGIEHNLRYQLYRWDHLRGDLVIRREYGVYPAGADLDFGIPIEDTVLHTEEDNQVKAHAYRDLLATDEDIARITDAAITYDAAATQARMAWLSDIFGDILEIRIEGVVPALSIWDRITERRGADALVLDLIDRPEHTHALMRRLCAVYQDYLTQLERLGLLEAAPATIHCTGGFAEELPAPGFVPDRPRLKDTWAYGMSQIFSTVGSAMHDEYEIQYMIPLFERMGLVYYGCCEPLDRKIDIIRRLPNVRKVSMSPWADPARGAEAIGGDYVFSHKPNPAFLATDALDEGLVLGELTRVRDACRANGTPVEYILKDVSTVRHDEKKLWHWHDIVMDFVGA